MDKVIDIEERIPTLRERRRKRTNRKFMSLLFVFLILLAGLIYSQSKYSEIQTISISGEVLYSEEHYVEVSGLSAGESMWSFNAESVAKQLEDLEWVEKAAVEKKWLTGVEIEIQEYSGIGYLELETGFQKVLSNGYAMEQPVKAVDGPVFTDFEDAGERQELVSQLSEMDAEIYNLISQVILNKNDSETSYVTLYMSDGNEVHGILNSLAEKMDYYPSVIAQLKDGQKGVIDMEVGIFFQSYDDIYGPPKEGAEDEESEEE